MQEVSYPGVNSGWRSRRAAGIGEAPPTNPHSKQPLLDMVNSPQNQPRELRQPDKATLLHFSNTWLENPPLITGVTGSTLRASSWAGRSREQRPLPQRSSRSHLKMLTLKHSEITVR